MMVEWHLDRNVKPDPLTPIDDPKAIQLPGEWVWNEKIGWVWNCIDIED